MNSKKQSQTDAGLHLLIRLQEALVVETWSTAER